MCAHGEGAAAEHFGSARNQLLSIDAASVSMLVLTRRRGGGRINGPHSSSAKSTHDVHLIRIQNYMYIQN